MRREAVSATALVLACAGAARADGTPIAWARESASPVPVGAAAHDPLERAARERCGAGEAGLDDVARAIVDRKLAGMPMPGPDGIELLQRASGEPHPWARAWTMRLRPGALDLALGKLAQWLGEQQPTGTRRCGTARGIAADGAVVLAAVVVDALADLDPLPVRARTGQWLTLRARLLVPVQGAKVLVLGPNGAPRTVPASLDGAVLRARFAVDGPGELAVQVVADLAGGPRPVLEASVFGDVEPPSREGDRAAPGEAADAGWADALDDDERLARMLLATRAEAGVPPVSRDARLDAIAQAHAVLMAARRELAHDVGDGSPMERLRAAGIDPREAGENVARATTAPLAHRALWDSPSHRANTLRREFDRCGIGVARDDRGDLWVAELFVGGRRLGP